MRRVALIAVVAASMALPAAPAEAFNPIKPVCGVAGFVSGAVGKACKVVQNAGKLASAGKQLVTGHVGKAVKSVFGGGGSAASTAASAVASKASTVIGLAAIGAWVLGGAKFALHETADVLSESTTPQLRSTWFSATYWRMAAIATMLTLPFLFAAAVQALIRSDLSLLARAAFGYLPLAMLGVGTAAPVAMLLLVASDQLSGVVSSAAGNAGSHFLAWAGGIVGVLTIFSGSPFLAFLVGLFTAAAALALWLELLVREAAVYVIVLMLPLAFAALVWPARRIWAIRAIELLVALILSKFAIVAVLSLGGAAITNSIGGHSIAGAVAGGALVLMAAFAPWALLRLLPLAELASGAAASLRNETLGGVRERRELAGEMENLVTSMRSDAEDAGAMNAEPDPVAAGSRDADDGATQRSASNGRFDGAGPDPQVALANPSGAADTAAAENAPGSASQPPAASRAGEAEERLPGMEPIWQADNMSWRELDLGLDAWPPDDLLAGGDGAPDPTGNAEAPRGAGEEPDVPESTPQAPPEATL